MKKIKHNNMPGQKLVKSSRDEINLIYQEIKEEKFNDLHRINTTALLKKMINKYGNSFCKFNQVNFKRIYYKIWISKILQPTLKLDNKNNFGHDCQKNSNGCEDFAHMEVKNVFLNMKDTESNDVESGEDKENRLSLQELINKMQTATDWSKVNKPPLGKSIL